MEKQSYAGSFTALVLVLSTAAALLGHWVGLNTLGWFLNVSPIFLIILGLEYLIASNKGGKVHFAWKTLISSAVICFVATAGLLVFQFFAKPSEATTLPDSNHTVSSDLRNLHIDNINGSVQIFSHDEQTIKITSHVKHPLFSLYRGEIEIETNTKGDTFYIETDAPHIRFFFVHSRPFVNLTIYVPSDHPLNVEVEQKNGKIVAQSIPLRDSFRGKTTNGKIEVAQLNGDLKLSSTNGDIKANDISGSIEAKSTNGKIQIDGDVGEVVARTTNGSIYAESSIVTDDWELKTTNGKLAVTLPKDSDLDLSAKTTNGSVEAPESFQIDGKRVTGRLGKGTHEIEAKTTNGKLEIKVK